MLSSGGYFAKHFSYDRWGHLDRNSYVGLRGEPVRTTEGYAAAQFEFDARGIEIGLRFFKRDPFLRQVLALGLKTGPLFVETAPLFGDAFRFPEQFGLEFLDSRLRFAERGFPLLVAVTFGVQRGTFALELGHALAQGRAWNAGLATLEVRRGNAPAIALYEHAGFRTVHVRRQYYQDNGEDALVMVTELTP
jgi:hypothetical protein